jgi:hypothetical protein
MKIGVIAKVKKTGIFVEHYFDVDESIYKTDRDSLYGIVSDFLDEKHGDIFQWFRFWRVPN